jgi:hypothetical protein
MIVVAYVINGQINKIKKMRFSNKNLEVSFFCYIFALIKIKQNLLTLKNNKNGRNCRQNDKC